ncbi:MAG: PDZ domain-containing protein [Gemmatimonadaceae bacterium]|nr:PDZ domain-containing protein [Gemmatimonadaceae bacterium]MBA3657033.1 PDZ domain-containing protein [Gemmatimonadaceae bacterium]
MRIFGFLFVSLIPLATNAQSDSLRSAPISNVRYEVTLDSTRIAARTIAVSMTFDVRSNRSVLLSIPAWTPGSYEIRNFAKYLSHFSATQGSAKQQWDKVDYDTWRVKPTGTGSVTVRFDVRADTLENASAWTQREFAFFNGTNVFMYPEGAGYDFASTVTLRVPASWKIVTGMNGSSATRTFTSTSYHELVDHPFFVGRFDVDSADVAGVQVRIATYPSQSVTPRAHSIIWDQLRKIIPVEAAVFGETPFRTYTILQVVDSLFPGAAALEHENSELAIMSPDFPGSVTLGGLHAHEIFHAWNVKRLRPADMVPYEYDRPQPTTLLWVSEGITDYYGDLALVRGGVATPEQFYFLTLSKYEEVLNAESIEALEDLSLSAWLSGSGGGGELYYSKGALAGLMLDIAIRDASNNRASLDDVMRDLYKSTYKQQKGFSGEQWWASASRFANGKSFSDFYLKFVDGRERFPLDSMLRLAGLRLEETVFRIPKIGVSLQEDSIGSKVFAVEPGGSASKAGIKEGDYVVSLGGISADAPDAVEQFARKYMGGTEGTPISVDVRRGEEILHFTAPLAFTARSLRQILTDPAATPKAIAIREGLLRGTTQP